MLSPEQVEEIKKQLIAQIEANFPGDKKEFAKQQIEAMNEKELEEFLIKNNLIKQTKGIKQPAIKSTQCIFCSIVNGQIESYKIDENKDATAVLEINPISKAHTIIIPKKHILLIEKIPQTAFSLAKKIAARIKAKFKPKEIEIFSSCLIGHCIINVLPVYKNETLSSERKNINKKELEEIQKSLEKKPKIKTIKKPKPEQLKEQIKIPRRIP